MDLTKIKKNQSSSPNWQVYNWFNPHFYNNYVVEAVVLPDVCPAELMPNGTIATVKKSWLEAFPFREAIGDIGCAMSYARLPGFNANNLRPAWNNLYRSLHTLDKAVLGSGNHFIDGCLDNQGQLVVLVHLGSRMNTGEKSDFNFRQDYRRYSLRSETNHKQIWQKVRQELGAFEGYTYLEHDAVEEDGNFMIIRKGVTHSEPGQPVLIASSAEDLITVGVATSQIKEVGSSMSHGTGRKYSRGVAKEVVVDQAGIRRRLIIPDELEDSRWKLEAPDHYRKSEDMLGLIEPYIKVTDQFLPIAFMGGF